MCSYEGRFVEEIVQINLQAVCLTTGIEVWPHSIEPYKRRTRAMC